ncbi:hypothetical protein DH2020_041034 [Rehmannia glutinosa]|uniref:Histone H2A/H2B/H3 domain-containing protein n=1 Tax=Rehmannia glutinosa TaxID=99300 RepID=A0ABR0UTF1_REHGL
MTSLAILYNKWVFAKACEMFIMELSLRAWMHTRENNRRTPQRNDIADAIVMRTS